MKELMIFSVLAGLTLGFCSLFYPPLTQKIKAKERLYRNNRFKKTMEYHSISDAIRSISINNAKSMIPYMLYFLVAINILVSRYGKIEYGDNEPYFIFLVFVGIPFVACFIHFILKIYFHEMIITKSNLEKEKGNALIAATTFTVPLIMLLYVQKLLHLANQYPIDIMKFIR